MPAWRLCLLLAVSMCALAVPNAHAAWPEKPITITVGFGAGGTTDVAARVVGEVLSKQLGQPVVIENKPGAGGALAATALMKAAADGYSLVANTSTTMTFDPHATQLAYGVDDFTYIAAIGEFPEAYIALARQGLEDAWRCPRRRQGEGAQLRVDHVDRPRGLGAHRQEVGHAALGRADARRRRGRDAGDGRPRRSRLQLRRLHPAGQGRPGQGAGGAERQASRWRCPTRRHCSSSATISPASTSFCSWRPKGLPADIRGKLLSAFAAAAKDEKIVDLMDKRSLGNTVLVGDELTETMRAHSARFKDDDRPEQGAVSDAAAGDGRLSRRGAPGSGRRRRRWGWQRSGSFPGRRRRGRCWGCRRHSCRRFAPRPSSRSRCSDWRCGCGSRSRCGRSGSAAWSGQRR